MRKWLGLGLICLLSAAQAAIYMQTDQNGNTVYSDTKETSMSNAVLVSPSGDTSSAVSTDTSTPGSSGISMPVKTGMDADTSNETRTAYTDFSIISPKDKETLQNPVTISVKFDIKPDLQNGDKVQLMLDNKPAGEAVAGTSGILPWIERGIHQVSAVIIDANQQVVKSSNSITIYVMRVGLNSPARQQSLYQNDDHKMMPVTSPS